MRTTAIWLSLFLLAACRKQTSPAELIEPGRALAGIQLGMTREELRAQLGAPSQSVGPDRNGRSALSYPGGFSAVCDSNGLVVSIQAGEKFRGRTKEGIGIGSSKADVVRAFGAPDKTEANTDTSASIYYFERGLRLNIGTNGKVEHIWVRPKGRA